MYILVTKAQHNECNVKKVVVCSMTEVQRQGSYLIECSIVTILCKLNKTSRVTGTQRVGRLLGNQLLVLFRQLFIYSPFM